MTMESHETFDGYLYVGDCLNASGKLPEVERYICFRNGRFYQAANKAEARVIVENRDVGAVLVDQHLAFGSGLDLMRWLQNFTSVPMIIVVVSGLPVDIVVALESGAADAVYADVGVRELVARLNAAMRKYETRKSGLALSSYALAGAGKASERIPLFFAPRSRRLYFSDTSRVLLHGKEGDLLALLIARHPDFIDREEISRRIFLREWHPQDRGIDNLVSRLRKAVDGSEGEFSSSVIETVRNEGYRLRYPIELLHFDNGVEEEDGGGIGMETNWERR